MEQKKRSFSGFDVFLLLLALLVAGAWLWITQRPSDVEPVFYGSRATYLIEVSNITQEQADQVRPGDQLQEGTQHLPIGQVIAVERQPFELRVDDWETQTITFQEVPERYTLIITVETLVAETAQDVTTEGGLIIKGGRFLSFTGPGYSFTGAVILSLERGA